MRRAGALVVLLLMLLAGAPSVFFAESVPAVFQANLLRPEWTVQRKAGRARLVGYIYNDNDLRMAANVRLRVEQVTSSGAVANVYQSFVMGDIYMRGRMPFEVPVADGDASATYRVSVESVDWVMECR